MATTRGQWAIAIHNRIFALSPLRSRASRASREVRAIVGGKSINKLRELARTVVLTREKLDSLVPRRTFPREDTNSSAIAGYTMDGTLLEHPVSDVVSHPRLLASVSTVHLSYNSVCCR
jgi:hypothetical protein